MSEPTMPEELYNILGAMELETASGLLDAEDIETMADRAVDGKTRAVALIAETFERWQAERNYPVKVIEEIATRYLVRAEAAEAECRKWSDAADKAQQLPQFYEDYSEGTMRAMQALMTKAIARGEAAGKRVRELEEGLRFYADANNYEARNTGIGMMPSLTDVDGGDKARALLKEVRE